MSVDVALAAGSIGSSVAGVSVAVVTLTSIAGSTSGAAGSGAVGAVGSGSTGSAGVGVADSRSAIASVPNWASTAVLNVSIWRSVNMVQHHQRCIDLDDRRASKLARLIATAGGSRQSSLSLVWSAVI